jgi:hypothetical protein
MALRHGRSLRLKKAQGRQSGRNSGTSSSFVFRFLRSASAKNEIQIGLSLARHFQFLVAQRAPGFFAPLG